jgi:hypothetical protein
MATEDAGGVSACAGTHQAGAAGTARAVDAIAAERSPFSPTWICLTFFLKTGGVEGSSEL